MPRIEPIPWNDLTPAQREAMQAGLDSGAYTDPLPLQIMAYADHEQVPEDGDRHPNFPRHLLEGKLLELLRIRSAQLTDREMLALEYIELMATDHHRIGDDMYRRLAEHFTVAEIVELGLTCSHMIGTHRFIHTLDIYGDADPVLSYDPGQVGVTWEEARAEPARSD